MPLDISDPDYPIPNEIIEAANKAVQDRCFSYSWFPEAIEAMAEATRIKYGIEATINDIFITPGILPSIKLTALYACKPGDQIIVPSIMYDSFLEVIDSIGAKPVYLEIKEEENWKFNIDRLNEIVTHKTRLIYLCNPHNPIGRVMTKKELRGIADITLDNNLIVATDEVHADIVYDGRKHVSIASLGPEISDRTISMFGLSKTFALAGLHIGWLVTTNKVIMKDVSKIAKNLIRGTGSIALAITPTIITKCEHYIPQIRKYLQNLRDYGTKRLNAIDKVKVLPPEGTYVLWPNVSAYGLSSAEMYYYLLNEARVATSDGSRYGPGGEGYLRIVFPTSRAIFKEGLDRIEKALYEL